MSTADSISTRQPCNREDALAVLRALRDAGHTAYFAGGCVRDVLLGLEPKDWDVATDAHPPIVRKLFPRTQAVGAKFGVILVRQGASIVEVATFRTDVSYDDGRHPTEVKFTTAEQDAQRRDFTINGLFLDPLDNDRIIDFVGGQDDLKNKVLRAIGEPDHRFEEDHLRLLRAVRFAARFGLMIDPATATAIDKHAPQLQRISPERIAEELRLMLTALTRDTAFRLLSRFKLLDVILRFLPEKPDAPRADKPRIFLSLSAGPVSFGLALAAITLDFRMRASGQLDALALLDKPHIQSARKALRQSLRISNDEADRLTGTMSFAHLLQPVPPTVALVKRFLAQSASRDARALMSAIVKCGELVDRINALLKNCEEIEKSEVAPPPLLTGDELVAAGYQPGPAFKRVLDQVYDAQLEDRITSKDEALTLARSMLSG